MLSEYCGFGKAKPMATQLFSIGMSRPFAANDKWVACKRQQTWTTDSIDHTTVFTDNDFLTSLIRPIFEHTVSQASAH